MPSTLRETRKSFQWIRGAESTFLPEEAEARSSMPRLQGLLCFAVVRQCVHVPEKPPSSIKSFPLRFVNHFRLELFHRIGYFAYAIGEKAAQSRRRRSPPAGAQRFQP